MWQTPKKGASSSARSAEFVGESSVLHLFDC